MPSRIAAGRAEVADPPARHGVGLREAAHEDRSFAHAGKRAHRPVPVAAIGEAVVDLVRVDEQVVRDRDPRELVLDRFGQDGPGRVAWEAQEQRLGARRHRGGHRSRIQREVVLEPRRDVPHHPAGEDHRRDVGDVRGLVEDHLVTRVDRRSKRQVDRLGGPDRHEDLRCRVVADAVPPRQVLGDGDPKLQRPVVAGVVGPFRAKRGDPRFDHLLRGREVRLPHPEADHVVHRRRDVEEAANAGRGHRPDARGERAFRQRDVRGVDRHGTPTSCPRRVARPDGSVPRHAAPAVIAS